MQPEAFRRMALAQPGAREVQFHAAQQYRVRGKAFATLGWPEAGLAIVWLSAPDQARFRGMSAAVAPDDRARGKRGVTRLRLDMLDEVLAQTILAAAWRYVSSAFPPAEPRAEFA